MVLEKDFWKQWKRQLDKESNKALHYERIENVYGTGIPDILLCYKGRYILVELKVHPNKKQPQQIIWHRQHTRAGGEVWTASLKGQHVKLTYIIKRNSKESDPIICTIPKMLHTILNHKKETISE